MRLPAHERHERECARVRRADFGDLVAVGEFVGVAHRVHQHDAFEFRPGLVRAQHRQERTDAGAGRKAPQHVGLRHFADGEKTVGAGASQTGSPTSSAASLGVSGPPGKTMK